MAPSFSGNVWLRSSSFCCLWQSLHKDEIHRSHKAKEGCEMVPVQALPLKQDTGNDSEDDKRHAFLYHLQLHQGEGTAIVDETDAVGRHLATVFEESYRPTECYDANQWPISAHADLLKF